MDVDSSEWGGFLYEDKQLSTRMDSEMANCYGGYTIPGAYLVHFMGRFFQYSSGPPSQINMLYSNESIY